MGEITTEIIRSDEDMKKLRPEWQELFLASGSPPFHSWEWVSICYKWFGQDKHPYLICLRDGEKLVGLLPLSEDKMRSSQFAPSIRRLSFLMEVHGAPDYLDVIAAPNDKQRCADAALDHLAESGIFDLMELDAICTNSTILTAIARRYGNRSTVFYKLTPQYICPRLTLAGDWDQLLERTRRPQYFKYCLRRLQKIEGFEFRTVREVSDAPEALERFLKLHEGRWNGRGGSSATGTEQLNGFMFDIVMELARSGAVSFEEIWLKGACCASLLGFQSGDTFYFYLSGFDEEWSKYSLGFTLVGFSIREAVGRGMKSYDFLRGDESYKFDWTNEIRMTASVQVASVMPTTRLFFAQHHAKEMTRAILPSGMRTFVRKVLDYSKLAPLSYPIELIETHPYLFLD